MEPQQSSVFRESAEFVGATFKSLIFAGAIILFVMQATLVQGHSMEPSLYGDDRLMIDKITYEFFEPQRGDIVVLELASSEQPLIKRVIALAGETVEIHNGTVYVNGVVLDEPYIQNVDMRDYEPVTVSAEHVFVMGDNRPVSRDSRSFGPVDIYRIVGKARLRVWPPDVVGILQ